MWWFHRHRWIYNHQEIELATERTCACGTVSHRSLMDTLDINQILWRRACQAARDEKVGGIIGKEVGNGD